MTDLPIHEVKTVSDMARILGAKGGRSTSEAKKRASIENGRKNKKKTPPVTPNT